MKKKNNLFKEMNKSSVGMAKLALTTGVGSAIAAKGGVSGISEGYNTLAGFSGIAVTSTMGKSVIKTLKSKKKRMRF